MPANDDCNLNNPIHVLFSRENFSGFTDEQYAALNSTLRLASRCLFLDSLAEYIMTTAEGDMYVIGDWNEKVRGKVDFATVDAYDELENGGEPLTQFMRFPRRGQVINDQLRTDAQRVLTDLADIVRFSTRNQTGRCEATGNQSDPLGRGAAQTDYAEGPVPQRLSTNYPRAVMSVIELPSVDIASMVAYTNNYIPQPSVWNYRRWMELNLAALLLHEVSHALQGLIQGHRHYETFYKNSVMSEAGYDLTARVFGGTYSSIRVGNRPTTHQNPLAEDDDDTIVIEAMVPWPQGAGSLYDSYKAQNLAIGCRQMQDTYDVVTKMEPDFICRFFREDFWTDIVPSYGSGPLMPKGAPRWILTSPEKDQPRQLSHVEDWQLSQKGWKHMYNIILRQESFRAQDSTDALGSVRHLFRRQPVLYDFADGLGAVGDVLSSG